MSTIELLAPVGHREGLLAAVTNGADAIYVGGAAFGARKEAAFTNEELIEIPVYKNPMEGVKKENKTLSMDFVLSLLVGANKPEKAEDIEKMREINHYLYDIAFHQF